MSGPKEISLKTLSSVIGSQLGVDHSNLFDPSCLGNISRCSEPFVANLSQLSLRTYEKHSAYGSSLPKPTIGTMREKIRQLDAVRQSTNDRLTQVRRATDYYAAMLDRHALPNKSLHDDYSVVSTATGQDKSLELMEDENVKARLDSIRRKISQLEKSIAFSSKTDKMTSFHQSFSPEANVITQVSGLEQGRSAPDKLDIDVVIDDRLETAAQESPFRDIFHSHPPAIYSDAKKSPPVCNNSAGHVELGHLPSIMPHKALANEYHASKSISSGGSSLRPLNESQEIKLRELRDTLRLELMRDSHTVCHRCGLTKAERCVCYMTNNKTNLECDSSKLAGKENEALLHMNTGKEHPVKVAVQRETQTDSVEMMDQVIRKLDASCQASVAFSPKRMLPRKETAIDQRVVPFIAAKNPKKQAIVEKCLIRLVRTVFEYSLRNGSASHSANVLGAMCLHLNCVYAGPSFDATRHAMQSQEDGLWRSTGPSHSLFVNWQQMLAVLKRANPDLHEFCTNFNPRDLSSSFMDTFHREINHLLLTWKKELEILSNAFSSARAAATHEDNSEQLELTRRANRLAMQMEAKDTAIQRIQAQLDALAKTLVSKSARRRQCTKVTTSGQSSEEKASKRGSTHPVKVSRNVCKMTQRGQAARLMRDTKSLMTAING